MSWYEYWISQKLWYPHRSRSEQATVGSTDRTPLWRLSPIFLRAGVIMVISFSFHPLCLPPLQRRSFTFSAQWMSSLRVLCDPRGKTLITPNCFNLISRQRANKKSKYRTKGNLYRGGAEPDKEIGALWCHPIKIQFKVQIKCRFVFLPSILSFGYWQKSFWFRFFFI